MEYMTPQQAAEKWGLRLRSVQLYCANDKIPGAKRIGRQWFIPKDAQRPKDGRTLAAKGTEAATLYHFPALAFTRYYADPSDLSEDELSLLEAQKEYMRGNYLRSMDICNKLELLNRSEHVKIGVYCTIIHNCMTFGQYSQIVRYTGKMEAICQEHPEHEEDYRLLIAITTFQYTCNSNPIFEIDINKLSADALAVYQCVTLQAMVFNTNTQTPVAISFFEASCASLQKSGILSLAMIMHGLLSYHCMRIDDHRGNEEHLNEFFRIGFSEGILTWISKYHVIMSRDYEKYISIYGSTFKNRIDVMNSRNRRYWRIVNSAYKGEAISTDLGWDNYELLLLLSCDMTNAEIGKIRGIAADQVSDIMKQLSKDLGFSTKAQLTKYAKEFFQNINV